MGAMKDLAIQQKEHEMHIKQTDADGITTEVLFTKWTQVHPDDEFAWVPAQPEQAGSRWAWGFRINEEDSDCEGISWQLCNSLYECNEAIEDCLSLY